jgi:alpha-tubulin suppressor-like RCC1 family protein
LLTTWSKIASGRDSITAIKTDGTLWSWGQNSSGQLGLNNRTNYSSPKQVGSLTNWSVISQGDNFSIVVKTDGTLWSWGYNGFGELGLGNTTNYSSPKQVGSLTTWVKVSGGSGQSSLSIKTDGTLWGWGYNSSGQLGLNNRTNYSSPKQVGSLTTWLNVAGGYSYTLATLY